MTSFIAADWRCAAISWSGMGGSSQRNAYTLRGWSDEALGAIDGAGLDIGCDAMVVAHPLGG